MADNLRIKKIKLSNGSVYSIFDEGSLHLNENNVLITGNSIVDEAILDGHLYITEIDDIPVNQSIDNVLVQDSITGEIKKRTTNKLLEDIGGISYSMDEANGILSLQIGKQS